MSSPDPMPPRRRRKSSLDKPDRRGLGSVRRLPSGRYQARITGRDGQRHARTFISNGDADRWIAEQTAAQSRGEWVAPNGGRLKLREFIDDAVRPLLAHRAASTQARDEANLRNHVLPCLGDMPLAALDYTRLQAWIHSLERPTASRSALKPATISLIAGLVRLTLDLAVKANRIVNNPMAEVTLPPIKSAPAVYLDPSQIESIARAIEKTQPRYAALPYVLGFGGLRIGEALALRWEDVDLLRARIHVTKSVTEVRGELVEGPPKTERGKRFVPIPKMAVKALEGHLAAFGGSPSTFVFRTPTGQQVRANQLRSRVWNSAVRAAGLHSRPSFHDLRHSACAIWIRAMYPVNVVSKWAGHENPAFTLSRYGGIMPESDDAVMNRLDAFLDGWENRPTGTE